jgi:sulfite exporter TauE/SafE
LRVLTATMILLIGLRFLFDIGLLDRVERLGSGVWRRIRPLAARFAARPGAGGRFLVGVCWGLLPCGLVYTMLLTAASTASPQGGAAVMLAFGAGTLPSMLAMAWAAPALQTILEDLWVRRIIGFGLVVLAAWTLGLALRRPIIHRRCINLIQINFPGRLFP